MMNFTLSLEKNCNLAPEENFELSLAGWKSLQTREVWHEALQKEHAAQVKEKSSLST